jgi:hypothetical protein
MELLGIGSIINHPVYGFGLVINETSKMFWGIFQKEGLETIELDLEFKLIEACEDDLEAVSFYDVEKSLR